MLNRVFNVVFNYSLGVFTAVSELSRRRIKTKSVSQSKSLQNVIRINLSRLTLGILIGCGVSTPTWANTTSATIVDLSAEPKFSNISTIDPIKYTTDNGEYRLYKEGDILYKTDVTTVPNHDGTTTTYKQASDGLWYPASN